MNDKYKKINDDFDKLRQDIMKLIPGKDDKGASFKVDMLLDSMENILSTIFSVLDDIKK